MQAPAHPQKIPLHLPLFQRGSAAARPPVPPFEKGGLGGIFFLAAVAALILLLLAPAAARAAEPLAAATIALRNVGIAQLENEEPPAAEKTFRALAAKVPGDPLPAANLAIALLRQGKAEEARRWIDRALATAPAKDLQGPLLAIRAEVHLEAGDPAAAIADLRRAAAASPRDVEIQYALYRHANTFAGRVDGAEEALSTALERLSGLRPENLVVLAQSGARAIEAGDRAAATAAYLRLRELLWQAPELATRVLGKVLDALEAGDVAAARVPSRQLENVLRPTAAYRASLGELWTEIRGLPILRFAAEPEPAAFGAPVAVRFDGQPLASTPTAGGALAVGDFDGDARPDVARVAAGEPPVLEIYLARDEGWRRSHALPAPAGVTGLLAVDAENRGTLDLVALHPRRARLWRGRGDGRFDEPAELAAGGAAIAAFDFDVEGDLDLALGGGAVLELLQSADRLEPVAAQAFPKLALRDLRDLAASDLDRDGDLDLLLAHGGGLTWLDNLRQGRFRDRTADAGLDVAHEASADLADPGRFHDRTADAGLDAAREASADAAGRARSRDRGAPAAAPAFHAVASADLSGDGWPDLVAGGPGGLAFWRGRDGRFAPWTPAIPGELPSPVDELLVFDADNDGRLDLGVAGPGGVAFLTRRADGGFALAASRGLPASATALAAADLDDDGDVDLLAAGQDGLHWLKNRGGNRNGSLVVRLRGLVEGNSKNNWNGLGATLELWAGNAYQFREVTEPITVLGLGDRERADLLRVVWTNGVPENRFDPESNQSLVEEQTLKGSCPFLYAWDGERFAFVTDLLWGAPIGMPIAPGVWAKPDPEELVKVPGARPRDGRYAFRITEELWEAAIFDRARLWVVDHPESVEVASSLRIQPGETVEDRVLASADVRPVAAARDGRGRDVTDRVRARDDVYADGYDPSPFQGLAAAPWSLTFDLGVAPARPVRLHLDGWIFPADASLNLALAQRGLKIEPPRLEIETAAGWEVLLPSMGHPAGKTKTMVVDVPALPPGVRKLRIVTSAWISWDRVAWSVEPVEVPVRARLEAARAELRHRGFSAPVRQGPNAPHAYDYARVTESSPWLPLPGAYTRYGDVRELLRAPDSRSVAMAPGDELVLEFDARALSPPSPGWTRTVFLESHGWDKDADRNTWQGHRLEPLPFRGMSGYPGRPDERFPDTPEMRRYLAEWQTRHLGAAPVPDPGPVSDTAE